MTPESIHAFWFADALAAPQQAQERLRYWFRSTAAEDREIADRFGAAVDAAACGQFAAWESGPRSCLALILLLDQFPRNIHRATPAAFEHDHEALSVMRRGIAAGHLDPLHPVERAFLLMPYQHSEELACQREGIAHYGRIGHDAPVEWQEVLAGFVHYARLHLVLIERFGRFPHRNAILGRPSSPAELEHLRSNSEAFGQGGSAP
jgi:uncharacterized protein (DUF924 family)